MKTDKETTKHYFTQLYYINAIIINYVYINYDIYIYTYNCIYIHLYIIDFKQHTHTFLNERNITFLEQNFMNEEEYIYTLYISNIYRIYKCKHFFRFRFIFLQYVFGSHFFWCLETQTQQLNSALVVLKHVQIIKKTKRI